MAIGPSMIMMVMIMMMMMMQIAESEEEDGHHTGVICPSCQKELVLGGRKTKEDEALDTLALRYVCM